MGRTTAEQCIDKDEQRYRWSEIPMDVENDEKRQIGTDGHKGRLTQSQLN